MGREKAIILFRLAKSGKVFDLEVPLDITANEFVLAMNAAYRLNINTSDIKNC